MIFYVFYDGRIISGATLKRKLFFSGVYPCFIDSTIADMIDGGAIIGHCKKTILIHCKLKK